MKNNRQLATRIMECILHDMRDRRGFGDVYDSCDEEIRVEIQDSWTVLIKSILDEEEKVEEKEE